MAVQGMQAFQTFLAFQAGSLEAGHNLEEACLGCSSLVVVDLELEGSSPYLGEF